MMMWRKKKSSTPSPSQSSPTSSFSPLSWFSKPKKTSKNFECKPPKGEINLGCKSMQIPTHWKNGKFYGGDNGSDWRLSFGDENYEAEKSRMGLKSVWYDSESENQELKFNQMVSNIRKLRELPQCEGGETREFRGTRRKSEKERILRRRNGGDLKERKLGFEKQSQEKDIFSSNCNFETVEKDYKLGDLNLEEKSEEMKLNELVAKSENQRKSIYISIDPQMKSSKHSNKTRAYSPRSAYKIECKIKAIENMKRAKKKSREKPAEVRAPFDSFAVVKSSFDPQNDFRKSMIEMITINGITKSQELEELLACYLTLNADVYHDTIIKVFRQVWFELIQDHLAH